MVGVPLACASASVSWGLGFGLPRKCSGVMTPVRPYIQPFSTSQVLPLRNSAAMRCVSHPDNIVVGALLSTRTLRSAKQIHSDTHQVRSPPSCAHSPSANSLSPISLKAYHQPPRSLGGVGRGPLAIYGPCRLTSYVMPSAQGGKDQHARLCCSFSPGVASMIVRSLSLSGQVMVRIHCWVLRSDETGLSSSRTKDARLCVASNLVIILSSGVALCCSRCTLMGGTWVVWTSTAARRGRGGATSRLFGPSAPDHRQSRGRPV